MCTTASVSSRQQSDWLIAAWLAGWWLAGGFSWRWGVCLASCHYLAALPPRPPHPAPSTAPCALPCTQPAVNRRMDEWVSLDNFNLDTVCPPEPAEPGEGGRTRGQKRKVDDDHRWGHVGIGWCMWVGLCGRCGVRVAFGQQHGGLLLVNRPLARPARPARPHAAALAARLRPRPCPALQRGGG